MANDKLKANLNQADISAITEAMTVLLDRQTAVLATKEELTSGLDGVRIEFKEALDLQTKDLKTSMNEGFEAVMDAIDEIDVRDRVDKLEKDVKQLKLHNKLV